MASEVTPPSKAFTTACASESFDGTIGIVSLEIIEVLWWSLVLMLVLWYVYIVKWTLCVICPEQ